MTLTVSTGDAPRGAAIGIAVQRTKNGPEAAAGVSAEAMARRKFEAKAGQVLVVPGSSTRILVGVGEAAALTTDTLRKAAAALVRAAGGEKALAADLLSGLPGRIDKRAAAQAVTEGAIIATYAFAKYRTQNHTPSPLERVVLTGAAGRAIEHGISRGSVIAEAVLKARDLINEPPGAKTPRDMAAYAEEVAAANGLDARIWDEHDIERESCGGLRGVSLGSDQPPRLVKLSYTPVGASRSTPTLAIVGKGITFDSGGLSLKTPDGMMTMKCDMSGAAITIAAIGVIAQFRPDVRVLAYACLTENLPGPKAIKPGDVLTARNGKTMEVLNTDAEDRLVLADGLSLAVEDKADAIIDLATLTGAIVAALGSDISGLFSNHAGFAAQVKAAAERAAEPLWELPIPPTYRKHIDSTVADMKNIGVPGRAGSIAAAHFLQEFVGGKPWVHLDIAGTGWSDNEDGLNSRGGTAVHLRTIVELAEAFAKP